MCTKTKHVYGCGHCAKIFQHCGMQGCEDVARYQMPTREGDCARCKATGAENTRGIDGRGKHAREIRSRRSSSSSYTPSSPVAIPNMSISPWAAKEHDQAIEKSWNTPTRIKADDAWVIEHERRMNVVPAKTVKSPNRRHSEGVPQSRKTSPHHSYERIIEADEIEEPEELESIPSRHSTKLLPYELVEKSDSPRSRRVSHASDSSYRAGIQSKSSHRRSRTIPSASDGEDDFQLAYRPARHASRTESHSAYLPPGFELPPPSGPVMHKQWESCRQSTYPPMQYMTHYPRAYPVH